ncbi:hypothetical protein ZWY2020_004685 [Hordeum vulgare]|nr:hypothetical protein ZWY2020_004685 [Hordeum vulgare]
MGEEAMAGDCPARRASPCRENGDRSTSTSVPVPVASWRTQGRPAPGAAWGLLAGDGRGGDGPATARRAAPPLAEKMATEVPLFLGSAVPPIGTPCGGANARQSRCLHTRPPPSQSVSNTSRFGWTVRVLVQLKSRLLLAVIRREGPQPESLSAPILDEASHVANKFAAGRSVEFVGERSADFVGGRRPSAEHSNVACYGYTRGNR